jgi:ABC-type polysaccharide transport system permease subunit
MSLKSPLPDQIHPSVHPSVATVSPGHVDAAPANGLSGSPNWVGLANYQRYFSDRTYVQVILNTALASPYQLA